MSAASNVVELPTERAVEDALHTLQAHRRRILDDPKVMIERGFLEEDVRLYARFSKLYLEWCDR